MKVMYDKEKQKVPVKVWSPLHEVESAALSQLKNIASMPFIHKHVAAMPDVHLGLGATVGSVIATDKAIIPAAVGVDIGCGMMAVKTPLCAEKVHDKIKEIRVSIEAAVPVGFSGNQEITKSVEKWQGWGNPKLKDLDSKTYKKAIIPAAVGLDIGCGMMAVKTPLCAEKVHDKIKEIRVSIEAAVPVGFSGNQEITKSVEKWQGWGNPKLKDLDSKTYKKARLQLGSLGGGNHFIEICLDTEKNVWVMLHSGSRGIGNILARSHITKAKGLMKKYMVSLPDPNLSYFVEETKEFNDYIYDLHWAQDYALQNRIEMMDRIMDVLALTLTEYGDPIPRLMEVNCHHNYTEKEHHYGKNVWVMLHSGSRGIGNILARSHITKAKGLMKKYMVSLPDPNLSYFVEETKEFNDYIYDLHWAQDYALQNRT